MRRNHFESGHSCSAVSRLPVLFGSVLASISRLPTSTRLLGTVPVAIAAMLTLAPAAAARVTALVTVPTTGGTRIVVRLTSSRRVPVNQRPRRVSVTAAGTTFKLARVGGPSAAAMTLGTWRTSVLKGSAAAKALALRGKNVTVRVGLAHGSLTLHSRISAPPGTGLPSGSPGSGSPGSGSPGSGSPGAGGSGSGAPTPLFAPPGQELTGQPAFDSFKQYFLNAEFTDCKAGHWPTCAVENRYEHAADGSFEYHRCTPTSGSDINFYDAYQVVGAAQHADGAWVVEYTDQNGAGFYHWEVGTDGTVNGYYEFNGGGPEALTGYYWRQPAHLGDCYS